MYKLYKPRCRNVRVHFVSCVVIGLNAWNSLPDSVSFESLQAFKRTAINAAKDSGRHTERSHVQHRGVKADWAAKITGHCSGEAASDGRPHHQDATWTTSQSCYAMDSSWKWQETRSANKDMAVHFQRRPCGQRSRLEQRPGCGYRQAQMANSCCPLSWQGLEDLSAK